MSRSSPSTPRRQTLCLTPFSSFVTLDLVWVDDPSGASRSVWRSSGPPRVGETNVLHYSGNGPTWIVV